MAIESRMHTAEGRITRLQLRGDEHSRRLDEHDREIDEIEKTIAEHTRRMDAQDLRLILLGGGGGLVGSALGTLGMRGLLAAFGL